MWLIGGENDDVLIQSPLPILIWTQLWLLDFSFIFRQYIEFLNARIEIRLLEMKTRYN